MSKIDNIENKIYEILKKFEGENKFFNKIYNYYTLDVDTFPYCSFELEEEKIIQVSNFEDIVEWIFYIYIFQEINEKENITRRESIKTVRKWTDLIKKEFQKNYTLDWLVNNTKIENIKYDTFVDEKWIVYNSKIELSVHFTESIL